MYVIPYSYIHFLQYFLKFKRKIAYFSWRKQDENAIYVVKKHRRIVYYLFHTNLFWMNLMHKSHSIRLLACLINQGMVSTYALRSSFNLLTIQRLYRNQLTGSSSESVVRKLHQGAETTRAALTLVGKSPWAECRDK